MLSTSILSNPSGPNELFTILAMDWAAMTGICVTEQRLRLRCKKTDHSGHEYPDQTLCRHQGKHQLWDHVGTFIKRWRDKVE